MHSRCTSALLLFTAAFLAGCGPPEPSYKIFVSNEASGDLTVINGDKLEPVGNILLGKRPRGLHASADGKLIYVALSGSPFAPPGADESKLPPPDRAADGIGVFDVAGNRLLRKISSGDDPEQFALLKNGTGFFVSNEDAGTISFVDLGRGVVAAKCPVGGQPEGVMMTPDEKLVYVTSEDDGTITVVDSLTT